MIIILIPLKNHWALKMPPGILWFTEQYNEKNWKKKIVKKDCKKDKKKLKKIEKKDWKKIEKKIEKKFIIEALCWKRIKNTKTRRIGWRIRWKIGGIVERIKRK